MLEAIVIAVLIAVIVGALLVYLLGPVIKSLPAPIAQIAGNFFVVWGWGIGIVVGLWWLFLGPNHIKI
jgi:hypothetical protein